MRKLYPYLRILIGHYWRNRVKVGNKAKLGILYYHRIKREVRNNRRRALGLLLFPTVMRSYSIHIIKMPSGRRSWVTDIKLAESLNIRLTYIFSFWIKMNLNY